MPKLTEVLLFIIAMFIAYIAIDVARYTDFSKLELARQTTAIECLKSSQLDIVFKGGTLIINEKKVIK